MSYMAVILVIFPQVLEYNVPGGKIVFFTHATGSHIYLPGKCNRGLMVIGSLRHLVQDRVLTEDEEKKALILGWCIEWVG